MKSALNEPSETGERSAAAAGIGSWGRDWALLGGLMLAYATLFLAYYPPTLGIEDEVGYLNQALVWSRGAMTAGGAKYHGLMGFIPVAGQEVAIRQPGRSLAILPFLL